MNQIMQMRVLDLCTGIGGLTLGYMAHDYQPAVFCEQNTYCQEILKARFGNVPLIPNIQDVTAIALQSHGIRHIDGIVAGLPCPAFSVAGKRKASQDERNLFPEFFKIVREIRPHWFVIENVPGLFTAENGRFFAGVLRETAALGFDAQWGIVSAASVGAVHLRERVFIIAYSNGDRCDGRADNWGERPIRNDNERNSKTASTSTKREQLLIEPGEDGAVSPHPQSRTQAKLHGCDHFPQTGANTAPISCGDADRRNEMFKFLFLGGDDGLQTGLDGQLLRHEQLEQWLAAATIPRINRLSAAQVAVLAPIEQQTYRECWAEYQQVRRQHKEAIAALGNAAVPQVAIKVFERLKIHV